jgi:pentatricopeptide repeat protein
MIAWVAKQLSSGADLFFDADSSDSGSVVFELLGVLVCIILFSALREQRLRKAPTKKRKVVADVTAKQNTWQAKTLEAELGSGNAEAAVNAWRSHQDSVALSPDLLRLAVQALLEVSPDTVVDEVASHVEKHSIAMKSTKMTCLTKTLDAVARSGNAVVLTEMVEAIKTRMHLKLTQQMSESVLSGYAFAGREDELQEHWVELSKAGKKASPRTHALVLRGLLQAGCLDGAMRQAKQMVSLGLSVPPFAASAIYVEFCRAGRVIEVLDLALPDIVPPADSTGVLLEHCLRQNDIALALRVKDLMDKEKIPMCRKAYDSLLKLLAAFGDSRALALFEEMQASDLPITEGFLVGLLARSAEPKFLRFADVVVKYAEKHITMSVALYSALMKVYAYSGLYDKACDLYDQILAEGLVPDQMMYGCLLKFAAMSGRAELSQHLAEKVPHLDVQNCMSLIRAAHKDRDVGRACAVLKRLKEAGHEPDTAAYNCVLDVCAVAGQPAKARDILNEMCKVKSLPDIVSYNTVLKCFAVIGEMQGAKLVLKEMEEAGFPPNDISYNVIINMAVSGGGFQEALDTIEIMTKKGIKADQYTISTLMKTVKKSKSQRDASLVFDLLDRSGIDILSDEVLLNTVLEASIRHSQKSRIEAILAAYHSSQIRPAAHTYGMLIRACGHLNSLDKCRDLWHDMVHSRALEPNEVVLGCMLNALVNNSCVEEALTLLREWKSKVKPNSVMYSTLLKGFSSLQNGARRSLELVEEMKKDAVPMTASLYNSLIDVQARIGTTDEVSRLRTLMAKDGFEPDAITMSLVVKSYARCGDLKMGFELFDDMASKRGGSGDTAVFNTLLDGSVRHSDFVLADYLIEHLERYKIAPTCFTLGIVVKMWGRRRCLDRAFQAVDHMTKRWRFTANRPVFSCLMSACLLNDDLDRALEVFDQLEATFQGADAKSYGVLISGAARLGRFDVAAHLTEIAFGLNSNGTRVGFAPGEIDGSVLHQLSRSLVEAGRMETIGIPLFNRLRAKGVPVGGHIAAMLVGASKPRQRTA